MVQSQKAVSAYFKSKQILSFQLCRAPQLQTACLRMYGFSHGTAWDVARFTNSAAFKRSLLSPSARTRLVAAERQAIPQSLNPASRRGQPPLHLRTGSALASPSGWNRFQPQIDPVQIRGTFFWTVISKPSPRIIRSKISFLEAVTFQLHARMLSSQVAQSLKSCGHFSDLGVEIALSHRHVEFFG